MKDHVHAGQVIGGGVHLLTIEVGDFLDFPGDAEEEGAGAAGGIVNILELGPPGGDDLGEDGADLLRGVEFSGGLTRAAGEFSDEVFVGVAEDIGLGIAERKVDGIEVGEDLGDELVFGIFAFAELGGGEIEVFEKALEVFFTLVAHGGGFDVF